MSKRQSTVLREDVPGVSRRQTGPQVPPPDPAETPGIDEIVNRIGRRKAAETPDGETIDEGGGRKKSSAGKAPAKKAKATKKRATKAPTRKKSSAKKKAPTKRKAATTKKAPAARKSAQEQPKTAEDRVTGADQDEQPIGTWTCPETGETYVLEEGQAQLSDGTPVMRVRDGFTLLYPNNEPRLRGGGLVPADDIFLEWQLDTGKPWSERHKLIPATPAELEANGGTVHPIRSPAAARILQEAGYTKVVYAPSGATEQAEKREQVRAQRAAQRAAARSHRTATPDGDLAGSDAEIPEEI